MIWSNMNRVSFAVDEVILGSNARSRRFRLGAAVLGAWCMLSAVVPVQAAFVVNGDVRPAAPENWNSGTNAYVAYDSDGTLEVNGGSDLVTKYLGIGQASASAEGTVTITGDGSTWTSVAEIRVGNAGNGTLSISNGAKVTNNGSYFSIGYLNSGTGEVSVDGSGSSLDLHGFAFAVGRAGSGSLSITNGGTVSSSGTPVIGSTSGGPTSSVVIDGTGSRLTSGNQLWVGGSDGTGTLTITRGGSAIANDVLIFGAANQTSLATVDGSGSSLHANGANGILSLGGSTGKHAMLTVCNGAEVTSKQARIGYGTSARGELIVEGAGSTWNNSGTTYVGYSGNSAVGKLSILDGASVVSAGTTYIASASGGTGRAILDGSGSVWNNTENLYVGWGGNGTLSINGGATVTAQYVQVQNASLLAIDVGNGSALGIANGTGTLKNSATVRILAGAGPAAGSQYTPISAGSWTGTGIYQAVGGTWESNAHQFTVSGVQWGLSGESMILDLTQTQRALVTDHQSGGMVGASFLDKNTSLDFTATACSDEELEALALSTSGGRILSAWDFTVGDTGYSAADPLYLSFDIGTGLSRSDLRLWHHDGSSWSSFDGFDLTWNGDWASFTANGSGGYAVSVARGVPAPRPLANLYGTGRHVNGLSHADGAVDSHYTLISTPEGSPYGTDAFVVASPLPDTWNADTSKSKWIGPQAEMLGVDCAEGEYVYRTTFDLTDIDPARFVFELTMNADNAATVLLNGTELDVRVSDPGFYDPTWFTSYDSYDSVLASLLSGVNTLDFVVLQKPGTGNNPSGLKVEPYAYLLPNKLLPGDLNGDGLVGSADLDIVRGHWNQTVSKGDISRGDPSCDGVVGSADLDLVRSQWGNRLPTAVPEPGAVVYLIAGVGLVLMRRRGQVFSCLRTCPW